jgi:hypothetical protein
MYVNKDLIKISFEDYFFKNFDEIFLSFNKNTIYYNETHMNYIYKVIDNEIEYTFNGFFKDDYLVIIFDSFNKNLNINIENKNVILIKLDWVLKKVFDENFVWIIDTKKFINYNTNAMILPIRNKLFDNTNFNIHDFIRITNYTNMKININNIESIKKKQKLINFKEKLLSIFKLNNEEF